MLFHDLRFRSLDVDRPDVGSLKICASRRTRRIDHAFFWPALPDRTVYPVPLDRLVHVMVSQTASEAVRRLMQPLPTEYQLPPGYVLTMLTLADLLKEKR